MFFFCYHPCFLFYIDCTNFKGRRKPAYVAWNVFGIPTALSLSSFDGKLLTFRWSSKLQAPRGYLQFQRECLSLISREGERAF